MTEDKKIIFIACGQRDSREKELGEKIASLTKSYDNLVPFLAEDTHSFDALTSEIFENLNRCVGFVAVLHAREKIDKNNMFRSSLWINQEIGIAAYLNLRDKTNIPVRVFVESKQNVEVEIEGVLKYIMVNSVPFSSDEEVTEKIKEWLDNTEFATKKTSKDYLLGSKRIIKLLSGYTGDLHTYRLDFEIANTGEKTVKDISLEFYFPKGIPTSEINSRIFDKSEPIEKELHDYYRYRLKNNLEKILPGKSEHIYCFDFQVTHEVYFNGHTHKKVVWKIFADDMAPLTYSVPLEGSKGEGINF